MNFPRFKHWHFTSENKLPAGSAVVRVLPFCFQVRFRHEFPAGTCVFHARESVLFFASVHDPENEKSHCIRNNIFTFNRPYIHLFCSTESSFTQQGAARPRANSEPPLHTRSIAPCFIRFSRSWPTSLHSVAIHSPSHAEPGHQNTHFIIITHHILLDFGFQFFTTNQEGFLEMADCII